ncbi:MAG: GNAT family N-acetyltransferase [Armatimonadota bacterium]
MQDRTTIRIVQTEDAQDLWENVYSRNTLNEVEDRVAGNLWAYSEDKALPLVAEVDGHVIATMYIAFDEHPLRSHICTLHDVVVNPGFQRMGIARSLFEECKALAAKNGKNTICISVRGGTTAETVYRKLGFTEYGRLPNGITESWGEHSTFDEVFFYMPLN